MAPTETDVPDSLEDAYICINGKMKPPDEPHLRAYDRGFIYGDGVFDSFPVVDSKALLVHRHVDRLERSATAAKIDLTVSKATIKDWAIETLEKSGLDRGGCRIVVSRGASQPGLTNTHMVNEPTVVVIPHRAPSDVESTASAASRLDYGTPSPESARIVSTRTIPPDSVDPKLKGLDYLSNVLAERELVDTGASVGIMLDHQGRVAEGFDTNVFLLDERGTIRTPGVVSALAGVTRNVVIERTRELGYDVEEGDVTPAELYTARDVFVTSAGKGIARIAELDGQSIGGDEPSPPVRAIAEAFREYVVNNEYISLEI
jgi:branched-chain amino acid aminotransferase